MASLEQAPTCKFENNSRPLDPLEIVAHYMHEEFDGLATFGNIQTFHSKEVVSSETMKKAVQLATLRNPLLGSKIVKNDNDEYIFAPITPEEIEFEVYDGEDWETILNTKTYEVFHSSLIKAVFLPNIKWQYHGDNSGFEEFPHTCGLYVVFHHGVCDDNGAARFTDTVLTYLNKILKKEEFTLSKLPMLPPLGHYLAEKLQFTFMNKIFSTLLSFGFVRRLLFKSFSLSNGYIQKFGSELSRNPDMERSSCFVPIEIGPGELKTVIKKCKENGTTVNGAVQAAYLQAFAAVMSGDKFETPVDIVHYDAVDFRRWYLPENDIPVDYCMSAAGAVQSSTKVKPIQTEEQFWEKAREMTIQTHKLIQGESPLFKLKLLLMLGPGMIKDVPLFNDDDETRRMGICLNTSNVGRCDYLNRDATSHVKMRSKFGFVSGKKQGVIFQNYIYTFEGRLFWSVTYEKHVVKPEHAEKYVRLVRNWFVKQSPE